MEKQEKDDKKKSIAKPTPKVVVWLYPRPSDDDDRFKVGADGHIGKYGQLA